MANDRKKCPACAEEILADARKCKHCGEWLYQKKREASSSARAVSKGVKDVGYAWQCFVVKFWVGVVGLVLFIAGGLQAAGRLFHIQYRSAAEDVVLAILLVIAAILGILGLVKIAGDYYEE